VVSRCANPSCEARFKYLHEGRLFQFSSVDPSTDIGKHHLKVEYWWLCPRCCSSMTLIQNGSTAAKLVLLSSVAECSFRQYPNRMGVAA